MTHKDLSKQAEIALKQLLVSDELKSYVDVGRSLPQPFHGRGEIRLVIIGQDPTVQAKASRDKISTVLNLDKNGNLRRFLIEVCEALRISLDENVYATNACKNFFTHPPTSIKAVDVLEESAFAWLPVLKYELSQFPDALVMSLGQPVLSMLVKSECHREMRYYWGHPDFPDSGTFRTVSPEQSTVNHQLFPMVHEKAWKTIKFYRDNKARYTNYIRGFLK